MNDRDLARAGYVLGAAIGRAMNRLRYYPRCQVVSTSGLADGFIVCRVPRQNDQRVKFRHNFPVAAGDLVDVIYDPALGFDVLRSGTGSDDFGLLSGTSAERLALDTGTLPYGTWFAETDTGDVYLWAGEWILITGGGGFTPGIYTCPAWWSDPDPYTGYPPVCEWMERDREGVIDWQADFGVPAGVSAVELRVVGRDVGCGLYLVLAPEAEDVRAGRYDLEVWGPQNRPQGWLKDLAREGGYGLEAGGTGEAVVQVTGRCRVHADGTSAYRFHPNSGLLLHTVYQHRPLSLTVTGYWI